MASTAAAATKFSLSPYCSLASEGLLIHFLKNIIPILQGKNNCFYCGIRRGNKNADVIGVYEALDMFLPGMFAYFSVLAGGVSANAALREMLRKKARKKGIRFCCPDFLYCTDNAAMIGSAGYYLLMKGRRDGLDLNATPYLSVV